ncbi:YcaO-like family protein [Streptomyces sp. DSM 41014]|uniref:YcaO-like family protein n=1 Tax=Streptomyces hintoniae TaxID=3075521 RepID=A0ABU2UK98_9ACTN|nr:YcaO-like family protein [Streptomyces sp. DSM 41014]MDT0473292.1 YcaO-like family protein [Streptomyces sp. DSM 41014]
MTPWTPQVFAPYPGRPDLLFARVAARSAAFDGTSAAGGAPVLVGSAAGHDRDQVAVGARGELLERLGNVMAGRAAEAAAELVGTRAELRRTGTPVLEPHPGAETRRLWVRGRTAGGAEVCVPAGAAFLQHRPPAGCDAARTAGSTGIAAHPDRRAAVRHAAWEVLERDLVRRSWYGLTDRPPHLIPFDAPPALAAHLDDSALTTTAFALPAPPATACVVVCLHRPDGTGQAFGARCGPADTLAALAEKAAYEALMVRWSIRTPVARTTWARWHGTTPPTTAVQHALWAFHRQDSLALWNVGPFSAAAPPTYASTPEPPAYASTPEPPAHASTPEPPAHASTPEPPAYASTSDPFAYGGTSDPRAYGGTSDPRAPGATPNPRAPGAPSAPSPPSSPPSPPPPPRPAPDPLDVLAVHTGQDVVLIDSTSAAARDAGVEVVRVLAPGTRPLPSVTGPGHPHPFG